MSKLVSKFIPSSATLCATLILGSGAIFAAQPPAMHSASSKAMREQMATMHERMAACLRSDRPISECRSEMMKTCRSMMGKDGCSSMGMGMGMGMGGMKMGKGMSGGMCDHNAPRAGSGTGRP